MILGHGNDEGNMLNGIGLENFPTNDIISILWLYSCNNAKILAPELNRQNIITIGFLREIIVVYVGMPYELDMIQKSITNLSTNQYNNIFLLLREAYYESSKQAMREKNIIQVAILNHKRLSLRVFLR